MKGHLNVHLRDVIGHLLHLIYVKFISGHTQENDHIFAQKKDVAEPLLVPQITKTTSGYTQVRKMPHSFHVPRRSVCLSVFLPYKGFQATSFVMVLLLFFGGSEFFACLMMKQYT